MSKSNPLNYNDQCGAALITVLFITALASIIIVSLVGRQQIDIRRTENVIQSDKAYLYAEGVIDWGAIVLTRDLADSKVDSLAEEWAAGLQATIVHGGAVSATMHDMQGRFNINNLVAQDPDLRHFSQAQFARMLAMCGLDTDLVNATTDWLDSDQEISLPGGAEDETYMGRNMSYRTADMPMLSPSELRLVAGFDKAAFDCIAPHISTLPEESYVNINTTTAFVLAAASDDFSLQDGEDVLAKRPIDGFNSVSSFFQDKIVVERNFFDPFLTVSSSYFLASVQVELGSGNVKMYALYERHEGQAIAIYKSFGVY